MESQIDLNHLGDGDELHFIDWNQGEFMKHKAYRWSILKLRFVKLDDDNKPTEKSIAPGSMKKKLTSVQGRIAIIRSPYLIAAVPETDHGLKEHVYHGLIPTPIWVAFKARSAGKRLSLVKQDGSVSDLPVSDIGLTECVQRMTDSSISKWAISDGTSWTFNYPESKVRWIEGIPYQPSSDGWLCLSRRVRHKIVGVRSSNLSKYKGRPITIHWIGSYLCSSRKWVRDITEAWRKRIGGYIGILDMSTIRVDTELLPRYFVDSLLLHRSRFALRESQPDQFDEPWRNVFSIIEHYTDTSHVTQSLEKFGDKPMREMMKFVWDICPLAFSDTVKMLRQANLIPRNEILPLE